MFGSILSTTVSSTVDPESITTANTYDMYGDWLFRLTGTVVQDSTGAIVRKTAQSFYDHDTYESGLLIGRTGNLKEKIVWWDGNDNGVVGNLVGDPTVTYKYDQYGHVKSVTDPKGNETTTEYDALTQTYPIKTTAPSTQREDLSWADHVVENLEIDYRYGKATRVKDENGQITVYTSDAFGRLTRLQTPGGGETVTEYHDEVFPRYVISKVKETTTGWIVKYQYLDGFGRGIQTIAFGPAGESVVSRSYYDDMGRNYRVEGPFTGTGTGFPINPPPTGPYPWVLTEYDEQGRPETTETPDGTHGSLFSTIVYEGMATTVIDPDNKKKKEIRDYLGRLREVVEYADIGEQHTYYDYNAAGDLLKVTDHYGFETIIHYDSLGRKTNMDDPDMGHWQYTYDANGNLETQVDANGQTTTFFYDELGRSTQKIYDVLDPDSATNSVEYYYDDATVSNGNGRLAKVTNGDVTTEYLIYDAMGRVQRESKTIAGGPPYSTSYSYDITGKLIGMIYPDNTSLTYEYYPGTGLLDKVGNSLEYADYTYYSDGRINQIHYGNDTTTTYIYDDWSFRLKDLRTQTPGGGYIQYKTYDYTPAGDVEQITDAASGITYTYIYDNLHRLISENNSASVPSEVFDTIVNHYEYPADPTNPRPVPVHAVKRVTMNNVNYDYAYDGNGNMIAGPNLTDPSNVHTRLITYNAENMPTRITIQETGDQVDYIYDGNGTRAKKVVNGTSSTYYIGEHFEIINGVVTKYIFAGNTRVAMVESGQTASIRYFHKDHLGSSTIITGQWPYQVVETTDYLPYGSIREHTGTETSNYKFTGQELDPETGLYNYNARLYDPVAGMFVSADTIVPNFSDPQSLNRYMYARGNPLIYTDPSGHFLWTPVIIGALVGGVSAGIQSDWNLGATLAGAFIGGVSGGVYSGVSSAVTSVIKGAVTNTIMSNAILGAVGGAAAGATAGGLSAAYYGGNIGEGIFTGAGFGALGGAAFGAIGFPNNPWKVAAYAGIGGGLSELSGGNFAEGAAMAGGFALAGYGYYKLTDIGNGGRLPKGDLSDGTAMVKTGNPGADLKMMDANRNRSCFGNAATTLPDLSLKAHEGWGRFRWLTSHVHLANDIAYGHDFGIDRLFNGSKNFITSWGTMLPAAALTVSGAASYYSPLSSSIMLGNRNE